MPNNTTPRHLTSSVENTPEHLADFSNQSDCRDIRQRYEPITWGHVAQGTTAPFMCCIEVEKEDQGSSKRKSYSGGPRSAKYLPKDYTRRKSSESSQRHVHDGTVTDNRRSRGSNSTSSSAVSDGDGKARNQYTGSWARSRLTSPSITSNLTATTTATNKSSGSSESGSTVTQASKSIRNAIERPRTPPSTINGSPRSLAVPDASNVLSFLKSDSSNAAQRSAKSYTEGEPLAAHRSSFLNPETSYPINDDTNLSLTSPNASEHSSSDHKVDTDPQISPASAKIAAQLAYAKRRQNIHENGQVCRTPILPREKAVLPRMPLKESTTRISQHTDQIVLPQGEELPMTGYELLASRLSATSARPSIKPIYRRFEALNHRLLLHLQDEIAELEEQLHRLDFADTQSRRVTGHTIPASRRNSAQAGGELQWHKMDILGRIGFKLAQYSASATLV